jgi:hypothetical protein
MTSSTAPRPAPQQLALLDASDLPLQFRLDQRTRQRGLAHIAAIRAQLAQRATARRTIAANATATPRRRAA